MADNVDGAETRPLKILYASARYAPFVGGTEIHAGHVARDLARRGHEVTVLTTQIGSALPAEEKDESVRIIRVPAWSYPADFYIAPKLASVVASEPWDIIHLQGYHTAVAPIVLRAAQKHSARTVLTFHSGGHSSLIRNRSRPLQVQALRPLLRKVDALIGVSEFEARLFSKWLRLGTDAIKVIPNGVSTMEMPKIVIPETSVGGSDGRTILSIGRLVRYKGHHRMIRAMPHLLKNHPDVHLLILGDGPYKSKLEALAARLEVTDAVTFDSIPSHERYRLAKIMQEASLAVLLSNYESHGMAAHEALTVGLPLVVLDRSALSDLAAAGLAGAVPPGANDREIAEIVSRSLDAAAIEPNGGFDSNRLAAVGGGQSWKVIGGSLESLYYELVQS